MDFTLESSRPIWQQLTEQLRRQIVTGAWAAGERVPSVRELASEAGVNPNTMQRAMAQLETDGLVVTNRTAGRTVTDELTVLDEMRRTLARQLVEKYYDDMRSLGYAVSEAAALAQAGKDGKNE